MGNINTKEKAIYKMSIIFRVISYTTNFKKQYKKIIKQGKDKTKLETVLNILISGENYQKNIEIMHLLIINILIIVENITLNQIGYSYINIIMMS